MSEVKEKYIGESKLTDVPVKKIGFKIKDGTITEEKLSDELKKKINGNVIYSLGFYNDDDPPTPMLMLAVRPVNIDKTIVPYFLINQEDHSDEALEWKWERTSHLPEDDAYWNMQQRTFERRIRLTDADFPLGWTLEGNSLSFKCTVTFNYEDSQATLINVITIV